MWVYNNTELMHYGVKGMKWGVRRAERRNKRADQAIRRIGTTRKKNELEYEEMNNTSRDRFGNNPKKAKKLNASLAANKALYDTSEVNNRYFIARQKARKDKSYKETSEYREAKKAYGKQNTQQMIYGTMGHQRIEQLKNMGSSEKQAKGRVFAEQLLTGVVVSGVIVGASYLQSR